MTNLPKTVQWVLHFLNINSKPGKLNPFRLPYDLKNLKRPPRPEITPSLKIADNTHTLIDENTGYRWRIKDNKPPEERIDLFALLARLRALEQRKMELLRQPKKKKIKPIEELSWSEAIEELQKFQSEKGEDAIQKQNIREIIENLDLEKDIEFEGINNAPTLEDYKQFFLEKGIPPLTGKELLLENGKSLLSLDPDAYNNRPKNNNDPGYYTYYYDPPIEFKLYISISEVVWSQLSTILSNMVWGTKAHEDEDTGYASLLSYLRHISNLYLECLEKDMRRFEGTEFWERISMVAKSREYGKPLPHYGVLPHALYARVLDLKIYHEELRSRLRQCPCCGRFRIPDNVKKQGRPQVHCSDGCEDIFNYPSRPKGNKTQQDHRDSLKDIKIKNTRFEIENYLVNSGYSRKEATEIYNNLSMRQRSSFKEFYRTYGQHWGL